MPGTSEGNLFGQGMFGISHLRVHPMLTIRGLLEMMDSLITVAGVL